jgi:mono/diheme cytochrome c family protein
MMGDRGSWMGGPGMMMGDRGMMMDDGCGMMGHSMQRHRQAMMGGLPAAYRSVRNPYPSNSGGISAGEALYQSNCAACHGERGQGDGPAASTLSPRPANLRWIMGKPIAGDGYLMWTISEGGAAFGSAMPAFKGSLSEEERWHIIHYLRTLR